MPQGLRAGFPTYWTTKGAGTRDALLIHCSLAHHGAWNGVIAALDGQARFTAFDLPGHGHSGDWRGGDLHATSTAIAASFLDGPMDIIGHSFGAVVALNLALDHPDKVRSLVMIEPVFFAAANELPAHHLQDHLAQHREIVTRMADDDGPEAARLFARIWGTGQPWDSLEPEQQAYMADRIHLIGEADPQLFHDRAGLMAHLGELTMPTLLIEGGNSPPIIHAVCGVLGARISGAQRTTVPDAGHMVPITHPRETAAAIRDFWTRRVAL